MKSSFNNPGTKRLTVAILLASVWSSTQGEEQLGPEEIVSKASGILSSYRSDEKESPPRKLHIVCWRPTDRDFAANHKERLQRIMEHIQDFYESEMERNGLGKGPSISTTTKKENSSFTKPPEKGSTPTTTSRMDNASNRSAGPSLVKQA